MTALLKAGKLDLHPVHHRPHRDEGLSPSAMDTIESRRGEQDSGLSQRCEVIQLVSSQFVPVYLSQIRGSHRIQFQNHASILHCGRISWRGPGRLPFGTARGLNVDLGIPEPRTVAAAAGLWPRRTDEDRDRHSPHTLDVRRAQPSDPRSQSCWRTRIGRTGSNRFPVEEGDPAKHKRVASPRPGHADLAGALKYNFPEARYVLERELRLENRRRVSPSRRPRKVVVARTWDSRCSVTSSPVGAATLKKNASRGNRFAASRSWNEVLLNCADPETETQMKEEVDEGAANGRLCRRHL